MAGQTIHVTDVTAPPPCQGSFGPVRRARRVKDFVPQWPQGPTAKRCPGFEPGGTWKTAMKWEREHNRWYTRCPLPCLLCGQRLLESGGQSGMRLTGQRRARASSPAVRRRTREPRRAVRGHAGTSADDLLRFILVSWALPSACTWPSDPWVRNHTPLRGRAACNGTCAAMTAAQVEWASHC